MSAEGYGRPCELASLFLALGGRSCEATRSSRFYSTWTGFPQTQAVSQRLSVRQPQV